MSNTNSEGGDVRNAFWLLAGGVGLANAGWAAFQWQQLLIARSGGTAFCPLGDGTQCGQIWDSAFASAIQSNTVLPIAAWGVVWGAAAAGLAIAAWFRGDPFRTGAIVTAAAGLASVFILGAASLASGGICSTCAITYAGVLVYAGIVFFATRPWPALALGPGLATAAGAVLVFYALLYGPAADTPGRAQDRIETLVAEPSATDPQTGAPRSPLERYLTRLRGPERQALADALLAYREAEPQEIPTARALYGPAEAPVRINDWIDPLCSHCKTFHETVAALVGRVPASSFSLETRHFPLDSACNALLDGPPRYPVRCEIARGIICMEDSEDHFGFTGEVLKNQQTMDRAQLITIAGKYGSQNTFEACLNDPATQTKLEADVQAAVPFAPRGTPLVIVNGRPGVAWGPFLYALILANGDASHPAFGALPRPRPANAAL
ncbi:MAG: thioredoxin domain-containing protein [Myxococcota bacterium]